MSKSVQVQEESELIDTKNHMVLMFPLLLYEFKGAE